MGIGSNIKRGYGVYTYSIDFDQKGKYYWILSPSGTKLAYVESMTQVNALLLHLNRKQEHS